MEECEVPPVARCMQRGRRFRDVFSNDRRVADLFVAMPELVVRKPDRF